MAATPISDQVYLISRSALDENAPTLAAIDRGCSLTKAVYVPKDGDGNTSTHYAMHCAIFANSEFEGCLHFLKANALLPSSGSIRVTGVGCELHKEVIEKILGLTVEFLDEFLTMYRGIHFFLSNLADPESAFYPPIEFDTSMKIEPTPERQAMMEKMMVHLSRNDGPDPNAIFPCIFVLIGSAAVFMVIHPDGKTKMSGMTLTGGKSLMGMGRAFAGTANYDELLELAKNGNCGNVDTTVEEFLKEDPKSPYGRFPRKLALFPFGKLVDHQEEINEYSREDRAASVVRLIALNIAGLIGSIMGQEGVSRVIVGGHGARGEAIRELMFNYLQGFASVPVNLKFLKTGATGAVGAMVGKPEDLVKYMTM